MPTLTQLEYLLAVETHRHFARAAKACFVTQPTLSMQLQKLEEELGVTLFDRSKKPILPTGIGKQIIAQARIVLSEFKKIGALSTQDQKEPNGDFSLAVIPTLSSYLLPLFLERFSHAYPRVNLHIQELHTNSIVKALEEDQIDAGLLATPLRVEGMQEELLFYEPFYLYARKEHPLARKRKVREEDLQGSEIWLLEEGHCLRNQVVKICGLENKKNILKNISFESGNLETLKRMVESSRGYTLMPYLAFLQEEPRLSPAKLVPFENPIPSREISLVYRRIDLKRPICEALKQSILSSLPQDLLKFQKKNLEIVEIQ